MGKFTSAEDGYFEVESVPHTIRTHPAGVRGEEEEERRRERTRKSKAAAQEEISHSIGGRKWEGWAIWKIKILCGVEREGGIPSTEMGCGEVISRYSTSRYNAHMAHLRGHRRGRENRVQPLRMGQRINQQYLGRT